MQTTESSSQESLALFVTERNSTLSLSMHNMTYNRCLYPGTVQQGGVAVGVYASMFTASDSKAVVRTLT